MDSNQDSIDTLVIDSGRSPKGLIKMKSFDSSAKRSPCRQAIYDRTVLNKPNPLPTVTPVVRAVLGTISTTLKVMSYSVPLSQNLASGRKATMPHLPNTKIEKIKIPRLESIRMEGIVHINHFHKKMNAEWVYNTTSDTSTGRICLYCHGGAYSIASRRTHRQITSRIAKYADCKVLAIDYRLAPQHVFPGPLMDAIAAYKYILSLGYKPNNISFSGDSSGGGLATSLMLFCRDSKGELPLPGCLAVMSPFNDMTQSLPSWHLNEKCEIFVLILDCYLPKEIKDKRFHTPTRTFPYVGNDKDMVHPYASPIFATSSETKICPTLIQVGDAERIRDDSIFFACESMDKSEPISVELYEDAVHVFQLLALFDSFANHALERLSVFIKNHTGPLPLEFESRALKVFNSKGYPVEIVDDLEGILHDGVELLLKQKVFIRKDSSISLA